MKDHHRTRIDSMHMDDDDCCCSSLSLLSSAASTTTTESAYSTTDESLSDTTRSLFDDIAVYSMIAQHYFTSSAPAFASELHTLLRHEGRLTTLTRLAGLLLPLPFPRRLQRPIWTFVAGIVGGGSSARKRIEETARRHLGMSLSVDDFQMLGRRISPRCVSEWDLEAPVKGIWNIYQAYYLVLCRLARGEYEESRQGWEGMVRDVRIVLQIIYTVACVGGGGAGVDATTREQCGATCLGGKHVMAKRC